MYLYILTGPAGAGKNTVASTFAKTRNKCAVIDVDLVRWMIIQPHKAPWEGEEGIKQQKLGVINSCILAKSFIEQGYDVIITDWISNETARLYNEQLKEYNPKIILLLPAYAEILKRNKIRPPRLKSEEIKMTYDVQTQFTLYDKKIDNTRLTPEQVVEILVQKS